MPNVAVAAPSQHAADAGTAIAAMGGNAVDAALASLLVAMVTEPGVCALGAGGYVTIWGPDDDPITIDGYMEMPGRGAPADRFGQGGRTVTFEYGGELTTIVGHGSVATPGGLKAIASASNRFGVASWHDLFEPAIDNVVRGFPLPEACAYYLQTSFEPIFAFDPVGARALSGPDGVLKAGDIVHIDHLAESLRFIAREGADAFYVGDIAAVIADDMEASGGLITRADLEHFVAIDRRPLMSPVADWVVATNPAPAIGGAAVTAMLALIGDDSGELLRAQQAVLGFRRQHLDSAIDRGDAINDLIELANEGDWRKLLTAPSTVHVSAVDDTGFGCAVTMSAGYGSGVMPPGTGIWMNNSLGEIELNRSGFHNLKVGSRLVSNMAPTVARSVDGVLAIGSPGADRITTAIVQVLVHHLLESVPLAEAIDRARAHVVVAEDGQATVSFEPGYELGDSRLPTRPFSSPHMFFGGVGAAEWHPGGGFTVAADGRRSGGTSTSV
ncbi:MAG: gamma-glutamyltransferase [Acidimicrobiia bacterium]|nr:gamma-glutamyltransferase [Acidimicrobiia bacterium]